MNKFLKISLWLFGGFSSILLAIYLLMLVINWSDEPPSSAYFEMTDRFTNRPMVPDAGNGFIYMMGICAPQGVPPSQFGAERISKANELLAKPGKLLPDEIWNEDCSEIDAGTTGISNVLKSCRSTTASCEDALLNNEQEIQEWLVTHAWLLDRYTRLLAHPKWATTLIFDARMPFFRYSAIRNLQDIHLIKAWVLSGHRKTSEVMQLLELDIQFWRNLLASADILLDRAVATSVLRRHFTFGNLILRRLEGKVALSAIPASWRAPIIGNEISMPSVATGEFGFSSSIVRNEQLLAEQEEDTDDIDDDMASGNWMLDPFFELSFQPQATLNATAALLLRTEKLLDVPHDQFPDVLKKAKEIESELGMYHWYNMSGRMLLPMTISTHTSLMAMAYDLEGIRRAALLTTNLRAHGINSESIVEALTQSDIRDPYTNEPFIWDAESESITYCGLRKVETAKAVYLF